MLEKHSITIAGHHTSITLEPQFWCELKVIAKEKHISLNQLVTDIDEGRDGDTNLSSAIRLYIVKDLKTKLAQK